jgi:hypothetical protein
MRLTCNLTSNVTGRRALSRSLLAATVAVLSLAATTLTGGTVPAQAATSSGCAGGAFVVSLPGGASVSGSQSAKISTATLPSDAVLQVRGRYVEFDFAPVTGNVYNYVYTGADNPESLTNGVRTPIWDSKTLSLGPVLRTEVEVRTDGGDLLLQSRGKAGKVKIQAKDCATGGVFQQEVEAGTTVRATHTLAPNLYYFVNPYTGKVNFGDGTRFRGKDSPQVATKVSQGERVTVWDIASGGRMGMVLGEDAVELSAGATACVSDCQAQNRIRGSLPVTDPAFSG